MKVLEASKAVGPLGKEYALGFITAIQGDNTIESEVRNLKEALMAWQQRRGKECRKLDLVITADESGHGHILEYIEAVLNYDDFIAEFKKQLVIGMTLVNLQGKACQEFRFGGAERSI
jgi:hypothetical protein